LSEIIQIFHKTGLGGIQSDYCGTGGHDSACLT